MHWDNALRQSAGKRLLCMRKATFPYITYNYPKNTSIFIFLNSRKYEKTNQSLKESLKSVYSSFSLEPIPTYACQPYMPIHTYYN